MFETIRTFITNLGSVFTNVSLADEKALQQPDNATVFVDRITPEYLTSTRVRYTANVVVLFSIAGDPDSAYTTSDTKLDDIETVLGQTFQFYEVSDIQYSYVHNLKRLFVYVNLTFSWEKSLT